MTLRTTLATLFVGAMLAPAAFATGEPKNEPPFTRPSVSMAEGAARSTSASGPQAVPAGEPKNQLPFTRPVAGTTVVIGRSGSSFSWVDAAIGLAAGLGVAAVGAGAFTVTQSRRRVLQPMA